MTNAHAGLLIPADVIKALTIEGYTYSEAAKIAELARKVANLGDGEDLIRVRDLKKEHIGKLLTIGNNDPRELNDIEEPRHQGRMLVLDSKLVHLPNTCIVHLTDVD